MWTVSPHRDSCARGHKYELGSYWTKTRPGRGTERICKLCHRDRISRYRIRSGRDTGGRLLEYKSNAPKSKRLSATVLAQIVDLRQQGFGSRVIARELSLNQASVSGHLRKLPRPVKLVNSPKPLQEMLIEHCSHNRGNIKTRLISAGLLKNECAICHIGPLWNGKLLTLRLDHVNGINDDYRIDNLRLLCPNCDSQTDTYCGRNKKVERGKGLEPSTQLPRIACSSVELPAL